MTGGFSPRKFLKDRNAVLVHFSTVMTSRPDLLFPDDLTTALTLQNVPLSFSTIQPGDTSPHTGKGGAEGSVGILVDLGPQAKVLSVCHADSGSSSMGSLGLDPTSENCAASIDKRTKSNEWHLKNFTPLGIFVLPPIMVNKKFTINGQSFTAEGEIQLQEILSSFPDQQIFTANSNTFLEYNRAANQWSPVAYDKIVPAKNETYFASN